MCPVKRSNWNVSGKKVKSKGYNFSNFLSNTFHCRIKIEHPKQQACMNLFDSTNSKLISSFMKSYLRCTKEQNNKSLLRLRTTFPAIFALRRMWSSEPIGNIQAMNHNVRTFINISLVHISQKENTAREISGESQPNQTSFKAFFQLNEFARATRRQELRNTIGWQKIHRQLFSTVNFCSHDKFAWWKKAFVCLAHVYFLQNHQRTIV